ncbi:zinc dependent phospholipase C family protein [Paenibacillus sp. FSL R5-0473]|uniref:zinc dependent phospholipase C family protein n=1 Tax=Paenibacillus sp. FSL R5-0473 TaxID=2921642 RepID=UPI0030FC203D
MPLPMVHLNIANLIADSLQIQADRGSFYLGNIAPDSIHMREGTTRDDKEYTHFNPKDDGDYVGELKDLYSFYMQQLTDEGWKWFVRGYFMHVLTDYYWFRSVHPEFVERVNKVDQHTGSSRSKDELARLYYQETDQIDFNLYQGSSWSEEVWQVLNSSPGYDMTGRLTADEIVRWRDHTFSFLNGEEPGITPEFITGERVQVFVEETVERLIALLSSWDPELRNLI